MRNGQKYTRITSRVCLRPFRLMAANVMHANFTAEAVFSPFSDRSFSCLLVSLANRLGGSSHVDRSAFDRSQRRVIVSSARFRDTITFYRLFLCFLAIVKNASSLGQSHIRASCRFLHLLLLCSFPLPLPLSRSLSFLFSIGASFVTRAVIYDGRADPRRGLEASTNY